MAITQLTDDLEIHQSLANRPNAEDGLSASQLKAKWDEAAGLIKIYLNSTLIAELEATTDGASGADKIGMTSITDLTGTSVQSVVESLKSFVDTYNANNDTDISNLETNKMDISTLSSTTDGSSGADNIGITSITDLTGTDVQTVIESLKTFIDNYNSTNDTNISDLETSKADKSTTYTQTQIDNKDSDLAGTGRTTETIKGNADDLQTHENNSSNPHSVTANQVGAYSKIEMQTSGSSSLHWDNLTNIPAMADSSWKSPVSTFANLPTTGNEDGDLRIVLDEDSVYTYNVDTWEVIGASGSGITDHGTLKGLSDDDHTQYLKTDGTRTLTGNIDFNNNQALNLNVHKSATEPTSPVLSQLWYDTDNEQLKVYKTSGWVDVSGQGAIPRAIEITASASQTAFDVGQTETYQYEVGTHTMKVYLKNAEGYYEKLDKDDYVETDSYTVTLDTPATSGQEYLFEWLENIPKVVNLAVQKDGTLQTNLNADMVDGQDFTDIQTDAQSKADTAESNANTYTDNKAGTLASLTTTDKSNLVSAINEVDGDVAVNSSDISTNTSNISTNTSNISANTTDIENQIFFNVMGVAYYG